MDLIVFLPAGFPSKEKTLEFMFSANADFFELGLPFSDPVADGPTIQRSYFKALSSGFRVDDIFWIARKFREEDDRKLILMSYFNPIYRKGIRNFVERAYESGFDALLVVDLPFDEAGDLLDICREIGMGNVFLVAPNTKEERIKAADELSTFIYLVSTYGVTGERERVSELAFKALKKVKAICRKPVAVGFGISKREHVVELFKAGADAVVVGSAVVSIIEKFGERAGEKIAEFTADLKSFAD